jgi:hypothetical protein
MLDAACRNQQSSFDHLAGAQHQASRSGPSMDETESRKHDRLRIAFATAAVSAAFAALLTYFIAVGQDADAPAAPGFLRLAATWLAFTILLALVFAAGIWRMTRWSSGDEPGIPPLKALIALASVVGVCALSPVPVFLLRGVVDTKVVLYGVLALCLAFTLAAVYFLKRRNPPGSGSA